MSRWYRPMLQGAALLVALLFAVAPVRLAHGQTPQGAGAVKVRVEVTDGGFNPNVIEVEQGKLVEITFVWAHVVHNQEEHVMILEGYKLETDKINSLNREATIQLVADKPGSFLFKCDLDCEVHDFLQKGELKVKRAVGVAPASSTAGGSATSTAPVYTPTTLTLSPSTTVTGGETVTLLAVLKDPTGAPVRKAEVRFFLDASLGGTTGKMEIGATKTDDNGMAFLSYQPTLGAEKHVITARFEGMGVYDESEQVTEVQEVGVPPSAYTMAPIGLESIRGWAPVAVVVVVLAIWATFGFILFQAVRIARVRARR